MSLDASFYMDEELGLDLKQPITNIDMTSLDLGVMSLGEKIGTKKVVDTEFNDTKDTVIHEPDTVVEKDSEVAMLRELEKTMFRALLRGVSGKNISNNDVKYRKPNNHLSTLPTCKKIKCDKPFKNKATLKMHNKKKHTYSGIIAGRVKKMKWKFKMYKEVGNLTNKFTK